MINHDNHDKSTRLPSFSSDIWGVLSPTRTRPGSPGHMAIEPSQVFRQIAAIVAGHLDIWTSDVVDP